ncbi:MAG: hypothetical protein HY832_01690 [Candidatus Aenigmarchaeota archaeon]|nr:hypothetical protein [Candidatus Aenigmarchaeota archaeon]
MQKYVNHVNHDVRRAAEVTPGTKLILVKNPSSPFLLRDQEYSILDVYRDFVPDRDGGNQLNNVMFQIKDKKGREQLLPYHYFELG